MCYPVCGMMHIKEPLLLVGKSSPCGGSRFPLSLSEWSSTICVTPYNHKLKNAFNTSLNKTFPSFLPLVISVKVKRDDGFHIDLDDYLMGLLQVATELVSNSTCLYPLSGARCSSVVRVFAHGSMGRRIDPSWWTH